MADEEEDNHGKTFSNPYDEYKSVTETSDDEELVLKVLYQLSKYDAVIQDISNSFYEAESSAYETLKRLEAIIKLISEEKNRIKAQV